MQNANSSLYSIQVNEQHQFDLNASDIDQLDKVLQQDGSFHILQDGKSYRAEVLQTDFAAKKIDLLINGKKFEVSIADHFDRLVKQLGLSSGGSQKVNQVKAPMPGLVLSVAVKIGQEVKKGDGLLILEAMKMENIIKSVGDGVIKDILIEQGTAVDKGQLLIQME
ncbi:MAG: biotin/lipoyl-containing protein [Bacteroidota bacterium]